MSNNDSEEREKRVKFAATRYITYPLRGYVSQVARQTIKELEKKGIDPDLAFSMVESSLPEQVFYDLPKGAEDEPE